MKNNIKYLKKQAEVNSYILEPRWMSRTWVKHQDRNQVGSSRYKSQISFQHEDLFFLGFLWPFNRKYHPDKHNWKIQEEIGWINPHVGRKPPTPEIQRAQKWDQTKEAYKIGEFILQLSSSMEVKIIRDVLFFWSIRIELFIFERVSFLCQDITAHVYLIWYFEILWLD